MLIPLELKKQVADLGMYVLLTLRCTLMHKWKTMPCKHWGYEFHFSYILDDSKLRFNLENLPDKIALLT